MFPSNTRAACARICKLSLAVIAGAALAITSRAFATPGDLYATDLASGSVIRYASDGSPMTFASGLISPQGIVFLPGDSTKSPPVPASLYVADAGNGGATSGVIFKYDLFGNKSTFASSLNNPKGLAVDGNAVLVCENGAGRITRLPTDGTPGTISLIVSNPMGIDTHGTAGSGFLTKYIATGPSVFKVSPGGTPVDIDPGDNSRSVSVDFAGNIFVTTGAGTISEIPADGSPKFTFASGLGDPHGMAFVPPGVVQGEPGFVYVADTAGGTIFKIAPGATPMPFVTGAGNPNFIVFETNIAPTTVTMAATSVTSAGATLNGTVNPNASSTTYQFNYGTTTSYGTSTSQMSAGSGTTPVPVSAVLAGLTPSTTYHFQLVANNKGGAANGADATFKTSPANSTPTPTPAPIVVTGSASDVVDTTATLNATVNPTGSETTFQFEYGLTSGYGSTTTVTSAGGGFTAVPVSAGLTGLSAGTLYHFRATATNAGGIANGLDSTFTTLLVPPSPTPTPAGKALNISTRVDVETGDNVGIAGFIINGGTTPKTVVIRGLGPSLGSLTPPVSGALADPVLELHEPGGTVVKNDNWKDNSANDQGIIVAAGLNESNGMAIDDLDSVIVATLPPVDPAVSGSGQYTAIFSGNAGGMGIGLVEVYDLDGASATTQLANISTRGLVGTGDNVLIGGLIIGPTGGLDATVLVRAIGPELANTVPPVAGALMDPMLALYNGDGDIIVSNDDWQNQDPIQVADIRATGIAPTMDSESALLVDLIVGRYTAIVTGKNATTGVALVEIYHLPSTTPAAPSH